MATRDEWVADGTPVAAPETVVTPAVDVPAAAPAAAPAPEPAAAAPVAAPAPTDAGTQGTPAPASAPAGASETGASAAASPANQAAAEQDFIDAFVNGQPIKVAVPKGASFQLKRGDQIDYLPITEAGKASMFERDYRIKTAEAAERQRQMDLREKILNSRNEALERFRDEQLKRLTTPPATPEEAARQAAFAELAQNDPFFKQMLSEAAQGRALAAEQGVMVEQQHLEQVAGAARAAMADIQRFSEQYHVDPDRLRERFAFDLQVNNGELSPRNLERLAQEEAAQVARATSPIQTQVEALTAKLAALEAAQAHNAATDHALSRSQPGAPGAPVPSAGAPSPAARQTQLTGKTVAQRSEEWARL